MIKMVVRIPKDKIQDITLILITIIHKRKARAAELESLAGKLNFISKVVPAGRSFTKRVYKSFQGVPKHRYIDLKQPVLADLFMWKLFFIHFKGWKPIIHPSVQRSQTIELFADASGNVNLGWGAWLPHMGAWMHVQWEVDFFNKFNPSIDFLELYALLARVVTWVPHLTSCTVLFHSDSTPTMHALINKSSDSCQMMILLRFLTLFCMLKNITITAKHISGKANLICDYLHHFKFQEFHQIKPEDRQP